MIYAHTRPVDDIGMVSTLGLQAFGKSSSSYLGQKLCLWLSHLELQSSTTSCVAADS